MSAETPGDREPPANPSPTGPPTGASSAASTATPIAALRTWLRVPSAVWRALFWIQMAAVTALMLVPRPPSVADTGWDKLNHVLAFAGPCFAGLAAMPQATRRAGIRLALGLVAWGGLLEGLQSQLPPRSGEWADLLADTLGVLVGAALYGVARHLRAAAERPAGRRPRDG